MSLITLTTDFGVHDWFVGTMKGVIAGGAPGAQVVDLTHEVAPGDIRGGAFALAAAAPYFPPGTIHVAVVDPGVGGARQALILRTDRAVFVGPDNGVLTWAVRDTPVEEARFLTNPAWFLHPVSRTFHGRDIFAAAAARLAAGASFAEAGEPAENFVRLAWPPVEGDPHGFRGEVIHVDRFGNAITNLPAAALPVDRVVRVTCGAVSTTVRKYYGEVPPGEPLAVVGSSGFLELAVNRGDFARSHGVHVADGVEAAW